MAVASPSYSIMTSSSLSKEQIVSPVDLRTTYYCGNINYNANATTLVLNDVGYSLIDRLKVASYHYNLTDHLGNVRVVLDEKDSIEQVNHYYSYGGLMGCSTSPSRQPYKFNGKEFDTTNSTNLYDYGARLYNPSTCIFTTADPLAEKYYGRNMYAYCVNNPVNSIDPDGRETINMCTDFYNRRGTKIGSDGIDNGVKVVVKNNKEARQISKTEGNVDLNNVHSGVILPSATALKESLNVLDRTIKNGGLREESSVVMNDGTIVNGQTGSLPVIVNGEQTANSSLPDLPVGKTPADVETTIHSHPTTVQQEGNLRFPQSALDPSIPDKIALSRFNTNIIVGPIETETISRNADGLPYYAPRENGVAIYDSKLFQKVNLTRNAINKILK